jgi:hypothetical protein
MTHYYAVITNRDMIKLNGQRLPFWHFLDTLPDGWLCSLAYQRNDVPTDRPRIWDCGAWSYKHLAQPTIGGMPLTSQTAVSLYERVAQAGDLVIAPDHIPMTDVEARMHYNRTSAEAFLSVCRATGFMPMACIHGQSLPERLEYARWLVHLGYQHLAIGGLAGRASQRKANVSIVEAVRHAVPGVWLHVLGLSAPDYMQAWHRLGVQSCDGSSHFKQAFTAGKFYTCENGKLRTYQAARPGEPVTAPVCECRACTLLRDDGVETRCYGSNETNMGRAAHNLNMLMQAHRAVQPVTVLVACVGKKHDVAAPAGDLYQSDWFRKARRYAEQRVSWFILSAQHGLLAPETVIEPYNLTLNTMPSDERRAWAGRVFAQIQTSIPPGKLVVLAGRHYREYLLPLLQTAGYTVEVPMAGLGIGQQLQWLDQQAQPIMRQEVMF